MMIVWTLLSSFLLLMNGCGGTLGGNPERQIKRQEDKSASLSLSLSSSSVDYAKNVYLAIDAIEISTQGKEWNVLEWKVDKELDLLNLGESQKISLGSFNALKPETYQKVRLVFKSQKVGRVIDNGGVEYLLELDSEKSLMIEIPISKSLLSQKAGELLLGIDLQRSLEKSGSSPLKYNLKPQLQAVEPAETGSLKGTAPSGHVICIYRAGQVLDADVSCPQAVLTTAGYKGKFFVSSLVAGTYGIRVFQNKVKSKDFENIIISAGKVTDLGDVSGSGSGSGQESGEEEDE
jgi:hypothetical protein